MSVRFIPRDVFAEMLARVPEWSMGYHFVESEDHQTLSIAICGVILLDIDSEFEEATRRISRMAWIEARDMRSQDIAALTIEQHSEAFDAWCDRLPEASYGDLRPARPDSLARLRLNPFNPAKTPRGPAPTATPGGRPAVHGHLPFAGVTLGHTVFYRAEPFPRSRYIDVNTGDVTVAGGLYGFPASEVPFVPTGFAAVGRYALPNVAPSVFRWELRAPPGVPFSAGASVPLYGQAGGGVELCIEKNFSNVGKIANPVILPAI